MNASDLFKAGQLQAAFDAQLQEVKAQPGDANRRLFLFELAAFTGDLDRAHRQIDMLTFDTPELTAAAVLYKNALDSEKARRALFSQGTPPQFFHAPPNMSPGALRPLAKSARDARRRPPNGFGKSTRMQPT